MDIFQNFRQFIQNAQTIVISTHEMPDADGIGGQVALCLGLRSLGKDVVCVNELELLPRYIHLDTQGLIISYKRYKELFPKNSIDLFIGVDTSVPARLGYKVLSLLQNSKKFVFIDHHPCSPAVQAIHCIDILAAATGELIGNILKDLNIPLTKEMALALYTSILIDTSSFRYPTVTGNTHRILGHILDTGVRPSEAYNQIYGKKKLAHLHLLGHILTDAKTTEDEEIAWIVITEELITRYGPHLDDTNAFINHLLILDKVKVVCSFRKLGKSVKVSFRSVGNIDVGIIAEALGGGGHNHSAATVMEGTLDSVVPGIVSKIQIMLKTMEKQK